MPDADTPDHAHPRACSGSSGQHLQVIPTFDGGDGVIVVSVRGEIDLATAPVLDLALAATAHDPATRLLVCDLSEVEFMSCAAMSTLLAIQSRLAGHGGTLRVVTRHPAVVRVLTVTGVDELLFIHADQQAALTAGGLQTDRSPTGHGR